MPWRNYSQLTDEEVSALWRYVRSLTAVSTSNR
jgi:hypothetical protein